MFPDDISTGRGVIIVEDLSGALSPQAIGVRVTDTGGFREILEKAIAAYTFKETDNAGELIMTLSKDVLPLVSGDVGRRTSSESDYFQLRFTSPELYYLDRSLAGEITRVDVVVFTKSAYLWHVENVDRNPKKRRTVASLDCTHVLLSVTVKTKDYPMPMMPREVARAHALEKTEIYEEWLHYWLKKKGSKKALRLCMQMEREWDLVADRDVKIKLPRFF